LYRQPFTVTVVRRILRTWSARPPMESGGHVAIPVTRATVSVAVVSPGRTQRAVVAPSVTWRGWGARFRPVTRSAARRRPGECPLPGHRRPPTTSAPGDADLRSWDEGTHLARHR